MKVIDPQAIHEARRFAQKTLAGELKAGFIEVYAANRDAGPYTIDQASVGRRGLKNACLGYLMELETSPDVRKLCLEQYRAATNMTDSISSLANLANTDCPERRETLLFILREMEKRSSRHGQVAFHPGYVAPARYARRGQVAHAPPGLQYQEPQQGPRPDRRISSNSVRFHDPSGVGYEFLADYVILLDPMNPQIASRLVSAFSMWKRYDETRKALMKTHLERILNMPKLSRDVHEIVAKSLA